MMLDYLGWKEAGDLIERGIEGAIANKRVTYDFERLMEGATTLKCSEFGTEIIANMGHQVVPQNDSNTEVSDSIMGSNNTSLVSHAPSVILDGFNPTSSDSNVESNTNDSGEEINNSSTSQNSNTPSISLIFESNVNEQEVELETVSSDPNHMSNISNVETTANESNVELENISADSSDPNVGSNDLFSESNTNESNHLENDPTAISN